MRRIQIYIHEEIDDRLQAEAAQQGRSKASLIRECVELRYDAFGPIEEDPITTLVGTVDIEPADVDEVVYGQ